MQNQTLDNIDQYLDTLTSPPKTTGPTPTGSSSTDGKLGDTREVVVACPKHGDGHATAVRLFSSWSEPECPECAEEAAEALRAGEAEREAERHRRELELHWQWLERRYAQSGLPLRYLGKGFDDYRADGDAARKALKQCRDFAGSFPEQAPHGTSLILCGNAGTGKTHLAAAVLHEVMIGHGRTGMFTTAGKVFRAVKSTYAKGSDDSEAAALSRFTDPALLVIDEVGVQFGSEFEKNILFEVINERYGAMRPTVLISNLALDGLREYAGDRVIDRMKENGGKLVVFDWASHRGSKSERGSPAPPARFEALQAPRYTKAELGL